MRLRDEPDTRAKLTSAGSQPPDWLHDAIRNAWEELRLFAHTLVAMTVRPTAFIRAWTQGGERALNPLAFIATCASLATALFQGLEALGFAPDSDTSITQQLVQSAAPFVQYAVVGALAHLALLTVRPRRRILDSIAVGLYAGGPAMVAWVVQLTLLSVLWIRLGRPDVHGHGILSVVSPRTRLAGAISMWLIVLLFMRSLGSGLAGLHGGRRFASGVATLFSMAVMAFVFGHFDVHAPVGVRLAFIHSAGRGWIADVHD